jgi:hypothetical protein
MLARRLGWPLEVVQEMNAEYLALLQSPVMTAGDNGLPHSCSKLAALRQGVTDMARLGEPGAARASLKRQREAAAPR